MPSQDIVQPDQSVSLILRAYEEASALRVNPLRQKLAAVADEAKALRTENSRLIDSLDQRRRAFVSLKEGTNMLRTALHAFEVDFAGPESPRAVAITQEVQSALEQLKRQERNLPFRLRGLSDLPDVLSPEVVQNASLRQILETRRLGEYQESFHELAKAKHEACQKELEVRRENADLRDEIKNLRTENERLRADRETLDHQERVLVDLTSENKNLRDENQRLRANEETVEHRERVLGGLTSENKNLQEESARLRADEETVKRQERVLVAKINDDRNMKQELEKRLISLETENSRLQQRNLDLENECQEVRAQSLTRLQNHISDQDMIRRLQEQVAEVENGRQKQVTDHESEKSRLQYKLKKVADELQAMRVRYRDQERDKQSNANIARYGRPTSSSRVPASTGLSTSGPRPPTALQASTPAPKRPAQGYESEACPSLKRQHVAPTASTPAPKRPTQGYESEACPSSKRHHIARRDNIPDLSSRTVPPPGFFPNTPQRKAQQQRLLKRRSR